MALENPVFARNKAFADPHGKVMSADQLEDLYAQPAAGPAETGRMTYDDVVVKAVLLFVVVLAGAGVGWFVAPGLALPAALVGLGLGLVNAFKKNPSPALMIAYAAVEGVFLGGISMVIDGVLPGVALQAVIATFSVFGVSLALFSSGKVRVTPKFTRFVIVAMAGYLVFSLVNVGLQIFGAVSDPWGLYGKTIMGIPLGVVIGIAAVLLATASLMIDFDYIKRGVENGAPAKLAWMGAYGLIVTLIWLYVEFLRLIAILRQS